MFNIVNTIKYEGDNNAFIWKHPCEDFKWGSQLIVHESQEAVFFMNGQALDLFGPGRYTLETENLPMIGKFINRLAGGDSPFHCEVYFINQTIQMGLKWGTDTKVRYIEPESGIPLEIGACGEMNMQVCDSRKLLLKLVGTTRGIAWGAEGKDFTKSIQNAFRPMISTAVKSNLTTAIKEKNINLLEIDEHLSELSEVLHKKIQPSFEEFGLTVPHFYLTTVVLPEGDPNFKQIRQLYTIGLQQRMIQADTKIRTAQALAEADVTAARRQAVLERQQTMTEVAVREAERKRIEAIGEAEAKKTQGFAEAEIMKAKGYTEKDLIQADVQKAFAQGMGNMGSGGSGGGSVMSDIVGLGVGMQAAGMMTGQINGILNGMTGQNPPQQQTAPQKNVCGNCGADLPENAKFCLNCGEKIAAPIPEDMIVCPECNQLVTKGKFCLECGHKFVTNCPNCGNELPSNAKFCLECGTKI